MATAGKLLAQIMRDLEPRIKPGVSSFEIDQWVQEQQKARGLVSLMKGYKGYGFVTCVSVNEVIVHGIPKQTTLFAEGDLVKVDVCAAWNGYAADMARCYFVGAPSAQAQAVVDAAWQALNAGIAQARAGNHLSDISAAVQQTVENAGFGVVRAFAGHGIGKQMHEDPEIVNYGKPGKGLVLRPGMGLAIEPMITVGSYEVAMDPDGWTARTKDGSLAAHVEDTVVVTDGEPLILTRI